MSLMPEKGQSFGSSIMGAAKGLGSSLLNGGSGGGSSSSGSPLGYSLKYKYNDKIFNSLDKMLELTQNGGSQAKALSNNLYGLNIGGPNMVCENKDMQGIAFFTRPQLNLGNSNLRNNRKLYSLLSTDPNSVHRYIRCLLDPRQGVPLVDHITGKVLRQQGLRARLLDQKNAFIPIFTNNLKSMSGWPDLVLPTYTSSEGVRREQWGMADGIIDVYESFDLDCTFRNTAEEPIMLMILTWLYYMACVYEGTMNPYLDFIAEREIDYQTRIYRLVLYESGLFVKKIAACGAAFPLNFPAGRFFDYDSADVFNTANKDINVRFKCFGAMYLDDILVKEFNAVVGLFNPDMWADEEDESMSPSSSMVKVPPGLYSVFSHRCYPHINMDTLALEWYVDSSSKYYNYVMSNLTK